MSAEWDTVLDGGERARFAEAHRARVAARIAAVAERRRNARILSGFGAGPDRGGNR